MAQGPALQNLVFAVSVAQYPRAMESDHGYYQAMAALEWQVELGATEAICDAPVNRFELPATATPVKKNIAPVAAPVVQTGQADPVEAAKSAARAARDLAALRAAIEAFPHCDLKRGAKNTVFSDGNPNARIMIVGEAPGRDEDIQGRPFVGRAGQLLDRMFAAIELDRTAQTADGSIYITNILPWRPPQNRDPAPDEMAMMLPFIKRHIELAQPDLLVLMGNISCQALLGLKGITRLRGKWAIFGDIPVMPMFHPAYLLRSPHAKKDAWNDLLMIKSRLRALTGDQTT